QFRLWPAMSPWQLESATLRGDTALGSVFRGRFRIHRSNVRPGSASAVASGRCSSSAEPELLLWIDDARCSLRTLEAYRRFLESSRVSLDAAAARHCVASPP